MNNLDFIIENYQDKNPFSTFLPGIAGEKGIPIWAFFVNRGQGLSSFGLGKKDNAIVEFCPFNAALKRIDTVGFRTFIKVNGKYEEAFTSSKNSRMIISKTYVILEDIIFEGKIKIIVTYSSIPESSFGGLVRKVEFINLSSESLNIEVIDGLSEILPYGISNAEYKRMSNLLKSWMNVTTFNNSVSFKLKSSTIDEGLSSSIDKTNFMSSSLSKGKIDYVYDQKMVFGQDVSLRIPNGFIDNTIDVGNQVNENETPCAFVKFDVVLEQEKIVLCSIFGREDINKLNDLEKLNEEKVNYYIKRNQEIIDNLTKGIKTKTSNPIFDAYLEQSFLDNLLRGGYPYQIGDKIQYIYSRKHGDLERDYNDFCTEDQYFSYGDGNFRDVLQNRRNDVLINKKASLRNIHQFFEMVQVDGNNPLGVNEAKFIINNQDYLNKIKDASLKEKLKKGFTLGELATSYPLEEIENHVKEATYLFDADFKEGYWVDHFIYLKDLLESHFEIYPDEEEKLLYDLEIGYFQSPYIVKPYFESSFITPLGVRRTSSLKQINIKDKKLKVNDEIYKTSLMSKLFNLVALKVASIDNHGLGIDMDASRPGWNDALNGLPNIYGSSVTELIELKRLSDYVNLLFNKYPHSLKVLSIQKEFINKLVNIISKKDNMEIYKEIALEKKKLNNKIENQEFDITEISSSDVKNILFSLKTRIDTCLKKVKKLNKNVYLTYVYYQVEEYQSNDYKVNNLESVTPLKFKLMKMPIFLEGIVKSFYIDNRNIDKQINYIENSELKDNQLGLYKVSESLDDCSLEIGRIRSFSKGWLERESCFLHMEYKYLYSLIKNKKYQEFYNSIKTALVCNLNKDVYGKSILENSSFIATSNHVDKNKVGQGFQPRLTGANAEVISMWKEMFIGSNPFFMKNNQLHFKLNPSLSSEYFINNQVSTTFLGININYIGKVNTYELKIKEYEIVYKNKVLRRKNIRGKIAHDIRNHKVLTINAYF